MGNQELELFYGSEERLSELRNDETIEVVALFPQLSQEYADMLDPRKGANVPKEVWVFYPWARQLVSIVDEKTLWQLRTNRNMLLVNQEELARLQSTGVLIAGLSVGASIAAGLAYSGIRGPFYLADFDEISATNLNRLRAPLSAHGKNKAVQIAQDIYGLDPYSEIIAIDTALQADSLHSYLQDNRVKILFDEVDDFKLKLELRKAAKQYKIPLIMLTALGDSVLIDVERYDTNEETQPFNGLVSSDELQMIDEDPTGDSIKKLSIAIVGKDNVPQRAIESLMQMGTSLSGRPQLYGTIAMEGGVAAYIVRQIILGKGPDSGRYKLSLEVIVQEKI